MKECKHCKTINNDDYIYCMNCGRKLPKMDAKEKGGAAVLKANKKLMILAAVILFAVFGTIFFLIRHKNESAYYLLRNQVSYIDGEKGVYIFESADKKADLEDVTADETDYSFDRQVLLIKDYTGSTNDLYVYYGGKVDPICEDVDHFEVSGSGETIFYTSINDNSIHLYQVKNKNNNVVFDQESEGSFKQHVLSYSGETMAYICDVDGEFKLYLYTSSENRFLNVEDVSLLLGVNDKKEVFYYDNMGDLMVYNGKTSSLISEEAYTIFANIDYSQIMTWGDEEYVLYENGKAIRGTYEEGNAFYDLVLPEKTLIDSHLNYYSSKRSMIYHLGVDDLGQSYYFTQDKRIIGLDSGLNQKTLCEEVDSYLLSADGKTLIWMDQNNGVHRFNGKSSIDFDCGENGAFKLCSWDDKNHILYFIDNDFELCASDGKRVTVIQGYCDPDIYVCCNDGYFYFKDGNELYAVKKESEIIEIGETYSSGSSYGKQEFYGKDGIGYQGNDKEYYFVKNAQAIKLETGEEVKEF